MPGKLFTPVGLRRRSAAQECADAHTASAERSAVGSVELASTLGEIGGLRGAFGWHLVAISGEIKCSEMRKLNLYNTT